MTLAASRFQSATVIKTSSIGFRLLQTLERDDPGACAGEPG